MKIKLLFILLLITAALKAQDFTQAVNIRPVKQVTPDSTYWLAEAVFVVYLPAKDSAEVVQFMANVKQEKIKRLKAQKEELIKRQTELDSTIVSIEKQGSLTEQFDRTIVQKVTGNYSLQFAKSEVTVKLNKNGIVKDTNGVTIGSWKPLSDNSILLVTDDYEVSMEWKDKQNGFVSVDKIKVKLIKQKSK